MTWNIENANQRKQKLKINSVWKMQAMKKMPPLNIRDIVISSIKSNIFFENLF